jgi:hypothetical protein
MKKSFLPTILLVCALIAAFSIGYFFRDAREPEPVVRERPDWSRTVSTTAPRRSEIVRPAEQDEPGGEPEVGRPREGTSRPGGARPSGSFSSRRPSSDDASQFGAEVIQPVLRDPQMRTAPLPAFYVPVRAGRPLPSDQQKEGPKDEDRAPTERAVSYAVLGPDGAEGVFPAMKKVLVGGEKGVTVEEVKTLSEGIASKADVLILILGYDPVPRIADEQIEPLKERKVIGIGYAAAGVFEAAGLKLKRHTQHGPSPASNVSLLVPNSSLLRSMGKVIPIYNTPLEASSRFFVPTIFSYHVDSRVPEMWKDIEVIAHQRDVEAFAPIVRQENAILVGVNGRVEKWNSEFQQLVRRLASAFARQ